MVKGLLKGWFVTLVGFVAAVWIIDASKTLCDLAPKDPDGMFCWAKRIGPKDGAGGSRKRTPEVK